jgi:hypothetical protein
MLSRPFNRPKYFSNVLLFKVRFAILFFSSIYGINGLMVN